MSGSLLSVSSLISALEEIEYDMFIVEPLVHKFLEWSEYSFHTFPKTTKAWTNLIRNDYSTFKFEINYEQLFSLRKGALVAKLIAAAIKEGTYKALPDKMYITIQIDPKHLMSKLIGLGVLCLIGRRMYLRVSRSQKSSLIKSPLSSLSSRYLLSSV